MNKVYSFIILLILLGCSKSDKDVRVNNFFIDREDIIIKNCELVNLDPQIYTSVVYSELYNNLNLFDEFDEMRADAGMDPSLGFSQLKVSTCIWIENNFADSTIIFESRSHSELLNKIKSDSTNILYAAFYIKQIIKTLETKLNETPPIGTIAAYYGYGINHPIDTLKIDYRNLLSPKAEEVYKRLK